MLGAFFSCDTSRVQGRVSWREAHLPLIFLLICFLCKYRKKHPLLFVWQLVRFVRVTFRGHHVVGQLLALRFPWNLRASLVTWWIRASAPMVEYKGHPRTREFAFLHSTELLLNEVGLGEGICLCKNRKCQEMPPYCCGPRIYPPWKIYLPGRTPFSLMMLNRSLLRIIDTSYSLVW